MPRIWPAVSVLLFFGATLVASPARAHPYDISIRGLGRPQDPNSLVDPAVRRFRRLSGELALALAPRPLQPAETLGSSGFEFSLTSTIADIKQNAKHWQGQPGTPVLEGAARNRKVPGVLLCPTIHVRKGLPLSTEVGVQATYLSFSKMVLLGVETKVTIHESYKPWVPAVGLRMAVGRLLGAPDIDMLTGEVDGLLSMPFGVAGMVRLTPFLGYGHMFAHVNSSVIDETPYEVTDPDDQQSGTVDVPGSLYTMPTLWWNKTRFHRVVLGLRVNVAVVEFLFELDYGIMAFAPSKQLASYSFKLGFDV